MTANTDIDALIGWLTIEAGILRHDPEPCIDPDALKKAATALRTAQEEREAESAYAKKCENELADMENAWREAQEENARMREALMPFAEFASSFPGELDARLISFGVHASPTVGDLRRARAALSSPPETSK